MNILRQNIKPYARLKRKSHFITKNKKYILNKKNIKLGQSDEFHEGKYSLTTFEVEYNS